MFGTLDDARILEVYLKKHLMNRCHFSKFKFIKCGLAEVFLVKGLDHIQDFV